MFYVYILKSEKDGSYYIGQTKDLGKRIKCHNLGYSKFTKAKRPWKLAYKQCFNTRSEAVTRELALKRKKNKNILDWLTR
ncbi:MAG: GIY-YIG nuclease family protein [Candidatus Aureabacteria bacterium]|nr:GIY-YIG nuclease family protein [Candidatus Auribacterota bacterium]